MTLRVQPDDKTAQQGARANDHSCHAACYRTTLRHEASESKSSCRTRRASCGRGSSLIVGQKMDTSGTLHIAEIPFDSGAVRLRYARRLSDDGARWIRHGRFIEYYDGGVTKSEGEYFDGKEEGIWRDFHANGQLAAEGCYEAGKESGVWRFYDVNGKEEKSALYRAGVEL